MAKLKVIWHFTGPRAIDRPARKPAFSVQRWSRRPEMLSAALSCAPQQASEHDSTWRVQERRTRLRLGYLLDWHSRESNDTCIAPHPRRSVRHSHSHYTRDNLARQEIVWSTPKNPVTFGKYWHLTDNMAATATACPPYRYVRNSIYRQRRKEEGAWTTIIT